MCVQSLKRKRMSLSKGGQMEIITHQKRQEDVCSISEAKEEIALVSYKGEVEGRDFTSFSTGKNKNMCAQSLSQRGGRSREKGGKNPH